MRARLSFALTALTLLFTLQALSVLLSASFPVVYDAVFPQFRGTRLAALVLPLAALLAPSLPFSRWFDRRATLLGAAATAAALRVPLAAPDPLVRLTVAALVVGAGGVFLGKAIGYLDRRSVAAGTATALLIEQLLRSAGWSWDVTLRPAWIAPQVLLSAAAIMIAIRWSRGGEDDEDEIAGSLERRAGGLRLRGGIALGCLLFLETAVLARPAVGARWSGASHAVLSVALAAAGVAAVLLIIARGPVPRGRGATAGILALVAVAVLVPKPVSLPGWAAVALLAAGHAGALLLLGRALVPAGGRRRGWTTATALSIVFLLHALLSMTAFHAFTMRWLEGGATWLPAGAALLAALALILMPRPVPSLGRRPRIAGAMAIVAITAAAAALLVNTPPPRSAADDRFIVATYNIHYGFDGAWRHDPEAIARAIEQSGADVVALQEVTAGLPSAYGVDLALWLGRRLGMDALYAPTAGPLVGDAVLARVPRSGFTSTPLPPAGADPKQLARLQVDTLGGFDFLATHLGLDAEERAVQIAAIVAAAGSGPAVLAGDLNVEAGDPALELLHAAGFVDAFEAAGATPLPTAPAVRPARRIDWVWLRGIDARAAFVADATASDHRLVVAELVARR